MNIRIYTFLFEFILLLLSNRCCTLNDTHAIILARGGSKGIINKNLLQFNGKSILARTIETIQRTELFANIWVSTDSKEIENEALKQNFNDISEITDQILKQYGAMVYRRLSIFAQDHSTSLEAVTEFLYRNPFVNRFALFQCTSVFLKDKYIVEAVQKFQNHSCVFAAKRSYQLRWKQMKQNLVLPLNFNPLYRPRRQDWDGELIETGMFYFASKQLARQNMFQNERCSVVEVDPQDAIEIDTLVDLKLAQCILTWNEDN